MNKRVNYLLLFLLSIITLHLYSCSGCSPSGRNSNRNVRATNNRSVSKENTPEKRSSERRRPKREESDSRVESSPKPRSNAQNLDLSGLYSKFKNSVFLIYTSDGTNGFQGTGFFISENGLAVSNYHVFEGTSKGLETIRDLDGSSYKIEEVYEKSVENDFIIFKVDLKGGKVLNPIPIVKQNPVVGEDVFAIGNPHGLESTLSKGIVSAFRDDNSRIQTNTEITHGSSGGPLLNMKGEVVGITTSGVGEANLNFAINIQELNLDRFFSIN